MAKDNTGLSNEPETFSFRVLQSRSSTIQPVKDQTRYVAKGRKERERIRRKKIRKKRIRTANESISSWISTLSRPSPLKPSNPLCIVHIRRQRQAIAGRRQKVHDAPQKDGRRWTRNKMKSATEFGAHAENYSRTRDGLNSNVFFALLVPSAFFSVSRCFFSTLQKRERKSSTYPPFIVVPNILQCPDSSAKIEVIRGAVLNLEEIKNKTRYVRELNVSI